MTFALLLVLAQVVAAEPAPMAAAPISDSVLAEQRGGFRLPNGIDVALSVQTQTALNGAILLRTVFQVDRGAPTLTIYAPKPGETVAAEGVGDTRPSASTAVASTISYDRLSGLQVTQAAPRAIMSVSAGRGPDPVPAGLTQVVAGTSTDAGTISATGGSGVRSVSLAGADLTITHLVGNAFGSAIANSGSDRAIDTQTTLSITLGNAGPDTLGSAMFRVQDMALDSIALRTN